MADAGKVFYDIVVNLLDDDWREAYVEELGDKRGPAAVVFAAGRTNERLGTR